MIDTKYTMLEVRYFIKEQTAIKAKLACQESVKSEMLHRYKTWTISTAIRAQTEAASIMLIKSRTHEDQIHKNNRTNEHANETFTLKSTTSTNPKYC